jgi:hypothetical protein
VLRASAKIRKLHLFFALESLAHVSQELAHTFRVDNLNSC